MHRIPKPPLLSGFVTGDGGVRFPIMISEGEFLVIKRLHATPVLAKGADESDEEFDLTCEHARDLLKRGLIHTGAVDPFPKSRGLSGGRYLGAPTVRIVVTRADVRVPTKWGHREVTHAVCKRTQRSGAGEADAAA